MFGIPGEYLLAFVMLGMGCLAFYAGSHSQEDWNELVIYEYDKSPFRRKLAKALGLVFIILGICMFAGLFAFGPECLAFLKS